MKLLVFDVGGTEIKYAIVEDALTIREKARVLTPTDGFDHFSELIHDIYLCHADQVEGIAMALPGPVDTENGICDSCGAMKYRHDREIGRLLMEKCGCLVVLENDGKAAALAECRYGSIRDCRNAAVFLIGTGVGGGIVIDGNVVKGTHFTAGEFSFINTEASHPENSDNILGNRCSTNYLLRSYRERTGCTETIDGQEFFRRLPDDPDAQAALDDLCTNIAVQIFNLYWLLDTEKIAIGGGISRQPVLIEKIKEKFEEVRKTSLTDRIGLKMSVEIVPCHFGNDANLIGAYLTYSERNPS